MTSGEIDFAAGQLHIDVRMGVVIVTAGGKKLRVFDRDTTGRMSVNLADHPEAEEPDTEKWEPFEKATAYHQGKVLEIEGVETWKNNLYTVTVTRITEAGHFHLSIKSNDRHWRHDWRHLQRIKNELLGPEIEAIELYPAESRLVDQANQFHLWAYPPGMKLEVGYDKRDVLDQRTDDDGSRQRPFSPGGETT